MNDASASGKMTPNASSPNRSARPRRGWRSLAAAPAVVVLLGLARFANAAEFVIGDEADEAASPLAQTAASSEGGGRFSGLDGRIGHIAFPAFGRSTSITHLELFPYLQDDNEILFGDVRGFVSNQGNFGGNFGAGFRFTDPGDVYLLGGSFWYDVDQTTGRLFHQVGLNLEARMDIVGLTGNFYLPVGNDQRSYTQGVTNVRFDNNEILFDVRRKLGQAMTGFDATLHAGLPGEIAQAHEIQIGAGYYHFQGDADDINGVRLQLDGRVIESLTAQAALTHDETFGTNATLGIAWNFGTESSRGSGASRHLRRFVDRNYNVIVDNRTFTRAGVVAVNPATGLPYDVEHVADAGAGNGTPDAPWATVAAAQAAGADVIYVQAGSVLTESITLQQGQHLLGEGVLHVLSDANYGELVLPGGTGGTGRPTILGSPGDAVTLADQSRVSGFIIDSPNGRGVVADGVAGASVAHVDVIGSTGDGVYVADIDDVLTVENLTVADGLAGGVTVSGGSGQVHFFGGLTVENVTGTGISIDGVETATNTLTDGTVETTVGQVWLGDVDVVGAPGGIGVDIADSLGRIVFNSLNAETDGGSALRIRNAETVLVGNGSLTSVDAPAADIEDSTADILLTSLNADGGAAGVRIVDMEGRFLVVGGAAAGSGGLIRNTDVGAWIENAEIVGFQRVDFASNDVALRIDRADTVQLAAARVTGTTDRIIDAHNVSALAVSDSTLSSNPVVSGSGIRFTADAAGSYLVAFHGNTVTEGRGVLFDTSSLPGAPAASLTYTFLSNHITLNQSNAVAAALNWSGPVQATAANNFVNGGGAGQTAFRMTSGTSADLAEFAIAQNAITLSGADSIAIDVETGSPATVDIANNDIVFQGRSGVGVRITADEAADFGLFTNRIRDTAGGATGVLFASVAGGTEIFMDSNIIDLSTVDAFVDRGIILSAVTGTNPFVTLSSNVSNTVTGARTTFFAPTGVTSGQLLINGVRVP